MIVKYEATIFDILHNKLSRSISFKTIEYFQWTNSNSKAAFTQILECYGRKKFVLKSVNLFLKKIKIFILNKEQNNSKQSKLLIGSIGFLSSSKLKCLVSLLEKLWLFWFLKTFVFWINNGLLKFATFLLLIWSTFCLVSAKKECFFFIFCLKNSNFSLLRYLALSYCFCVFGTTSFHNFLRFLGIVPFFLRFLPFSHIITLLTVHTSPYWLSKMHNWT